MAKITISHDILISLCRPDGGIRIDKRFWDCELVFYGIQRALQNILGDLTNGKNRRV